MIPISILTLSFCVGVALTYPRYQPATSMMSPEQSEANAYLAKYGYISKATAPVRMASDNVIMRFQTMAGLEPTGRLDSDTLAMMRLSRCGVPDFNAEEEDPSPESAAISASLTDADADAAPLRRKRDVPGLADYVLTGRKWNKKDLTYRVERYSAKLSREQIDDTVERAFKFWSDVSDLTFTRKSSGVVDIVIIFQAGDHGDDEPFDGRGGVLAHAFFPYSQAPNSIAGDAHFDDAERWTINTFSGQNLLQTATHEFGHSLGLAHSSERSAIMWAFARPYNPQMALDSDDIAGIRRLYGAGSGVTTTTTAETTTTTSERQPITTEKTKTPMTTTTTTTTTPRVVPTKCSGVVNAVDLALDGFTYGVVGDKIYRFAGKGVEAGFDPSIPNLFPGAPSTVDAMVTVNRWRKTYLFSGDRYWRYGYSSRNSKFVLSANYPKKIMEWKVPSTIRSIDAAFERDGAVYLLSGDAYWRWGTDGVVDGKIADRWPGLYGVSGALTWTNGRLYFFGTDGRYVRWNEDRNRPDTANPPYPRSTALWWFDCRTDERSAYFDGVVA